MHSYDVLVVGGGHAGTEAAAAAARRGARVGLITYDASQLGAMSCNPAIGGIGKGHIVREVDAFDGLIARAADAAAIHYRMLNRSKGVAVHGPRIQADRRRYAAAIQSMIARQPGITIICGEATSLQLTGDRVSGVTLANGSVLNAVVVVLATGTFLGGRIFRGTERLHGGRIEERAANQLGAQLRELNLPMGRLKTGTPPRLDGRTIDWGSLVEQPSDVQQWTMSPVSETPRLPQIACAITRTNAHTHDIIRANLGDSPLFSGAIEGGGPRYCPSIEDKVFRFGDRDGHQIFLEPEGLDSHLVYPNGISTSLPVTVQEHLLRSIAGLESCRTVMPGYAVEYDYIDPRALNPDLNMASLRGVYCAGQINGTTGYEEAAGQGLIAGLNAAAHARGLEPVVLSRATSYIGVMIDDLVLQGVTEPYRMLTARAEHRLSLRADNAETRLSPIAETAGCLSPARLAHVRHRAERRHKAESFLSNCGSRVVERGGLCRTANEWLASTEAAPGELFAETAIDVEMFEEVATDLRYAPYVARQRDMVDATRMNETHLPSDLAYASIPGLSHEMIERLGLARPSTLASASRIRGITPSALTALLLHVKRQAA